MKVIVVSERSVSRTKLAPRSLSPNVGRAVARSVRGLRARHLVGVVFSGLALLAPVAIWAESGPLSAPTACADSTACAIPYDYLSDQATEPFLFLGKQVDEAHPRWRDYARGLRKYPDVRSCLREPEQGKIKPDLRNFDWDEPGNRYRLEVCLFRIFASLGTDDRSRAWLSSFGFKVTDTSRIVSEKYVAKGNEPVRGFTAIASPDAYYKLRPSWWRFLLGDWDPIVSVTITAQFSERGQLAGVGISSNSL